MGILNRVSNTYKTGVVSHLNTQPFTSILKIFGFVQRKNPLELKMKFVVALMMMTFMVYCTMAAPGINDVQEDGEELQLETVDLDEEVRAGFSCGNCGAVMGNPIYDCKGDGCQKCIKDMKPAGNCRCHIRCNTRLGQEKMGLTPDAPNAKIVPIEVPMLRHYFE